MAQELGPYPGQDHPVIQKTQQAAIERRRHLRAVAGAATEDDGKNGLSTGAKWGLGAAAVGVVATGVVAEETVGPHLLRNLWGEITGANTTPSQAGGKGERGQQQGNENQHNPNALKTTDFPTLTGLTLQLQTDPTTHEIIGANYVDAKGTVEAYVTNQTVQIENLDGTTNEKTIYQIHANPTYIAQQLKAENGNKADGTWVVTDPAAMNGNITVKFITMPNGLPGIQFSSDSNSPVALYDLTQAGEIYHNAWPYPGDSVIQQLHQMYQVGFIPRILTDNGTYPGDPYRICVGATPTDSTTADGQQVKVKPGGEMATVSGDVYVWTGIKSAQNVKLSVLTVEASDGTEFMLVP